MARIYTTAGGRFLEEARVAFSAAVRHPGLPAVEIFPGRQFQPLLGFGIALTGASCHLLGRMEKSARRALLTDVFGPGGLGLSLARISVGASDYDCEAYTCDDTPDDWDLRDFSIEQDQKLTLPAVREANEINPGLFVFSSVWSPPAWMKTGGQLYGGWLREDCLEVYARYYVRFLEAWRAEGVEISALTPQNESETDQCGRMPACYLHPQHELRLVRDYLRPLLRKAGLPAKIWLLDHNYILWNRPRWQLGQPGVLEATDGVAFHYYEGTSDMAAKLLEEFPALELHWTEGGPNLGAGYEDDWCYWGRIFTEALEAGCRSVTGWNLLLDETGGPNLGPFSCAGLLTIDSQTGALTKSGQYRAFAHFGRFFQRGSVRMETRSHGGLYDHSGRDTSLYHTAFCNPDGTLAAMLTNPGARQDVELCIGGGAARMILPENSLTTIVLDKEEACL